MTDPYEFSRRVRCDADNLETQINAKWKNPQKVKDAVDSLRDLANEYDSRVARYEAEIAVLRAELAKAPQWSTHAPIVVPAIWPADSSGTPPGARMTGGTAKPTT